MFPADETGLVTLIDPGFKPRGPQRHSRDRDRVRVFWLAVDHTSDFGIPVERPLWYYSAPPSL